MDRLNPLFPATSRARGALLAAALLCSGLVGLGTPSRAEADVPVSLYQSFSGNINFVTTGGTRRTASNAVNACSVQAAGTATNMTVSGIPGSSTIVAAYLYWAGSGATVDSAVTFNGNNVTADRTFTATATNPFFSGFKDVTSLVTGNGTYTFNNLTIDSSATYCGNSTVLGAYALLVIYSNTGTEPFRVINIFDGFQVFQGAQIILTPNNFQIPNTGIDGKFAVITWEGDPDITATNNGFGETLQFNSNVLSDACDNSGNQYNSTINTITCTSNEATNGGIYWGLDFDTYNVSSYLTAGETSATTTYSSGQDLVFLSAQVVSVTNTPVSDLSITDTDGVTSVQAGNNTSYTLTVKNNGPNATAGTTSVSFAIDTTNETYVSATGTGWTCGFSSPNVTCTRSDSLASGSTYPTITVVTTMKTTATGTVTDTASVTGGNFDNVSGNSTGITDSDTVTYPSDDLGISKTAVGTFTAGTNVSYTVTVTNNGPIAIPSGTTTTVSDTLPATLTYVSATGTGWTCGAVGQVVTCTSTSSAASGASLPNITLTAFLSASVNANVVNTATVSNAFITDGTAGNNSSTSTVTNASINKPNYSTSTKTWVDLNGGDVAPGDTLEYTITVKDSANKAGTNIEVTDNIPAEISSFTVVSIPGGSTNASTGTGTGTNGTGYLDVTGINITANGTATIVFDVVVSGSANSGDTIDNTATVVGGTATATPAAPTATVNVSQVPASGNKLLYPYDGTQSAGALSQLMNRTPQTTNTTTRVTISGGANGAADWTLSPAIATSKTLTITAGSTATAQVILRNTGNNTGSTRTVSVELLKNGTATLGTSATQNFTNNTDAMRTFNITILSNGNNTLAATDTLVMRIHDVTGAANRTLDFSQKTNALGNSTLTFTTSTVINVDSITMYNAAYPSTSQPPNGIFEPGMTVFIRAVVSDPFGCNDVFPTGGTAPVLTLKDPNNATQVNAVTMVEPTADSTACTATPTNPTKTFEYYSNSPTNTIGYVLGNTPVEGFWTPTVKATEGTEGTVTHTANNSFQVRKASLVITKLVTLLSDPTNGSTRPKSIPGAVEQYTIQVSNAGKGRANAIVITDAIPTNTTYVPGSITFVDGSPSSGLSYTQATNATWSTTGCASGFSTTENSSAKCIKIAWTNTDFMNGSTGSSPSFQIRFNVTVN